jgi:hypothetical protein
MAAFDQLSAEGRAALQKQGCQEAAEQRLFFTDNCRDLRDRYCSHSRSLAAHSQLARPARQGAGAGQRGGLADWDWGEGASQLPAAHCTTCYHTASERRVRLQTGI